MKMLFITKALHKEHVTLGKSKNLSIPLQCYVAEHTYAIRYTYFKHLLTPVSTIEALIHSKFIL